MENVENSQVKSKRDQFKERMKGKYPDRDFDDDEVFFGQINDDYDDYDKQLSGYKERESKFSDMFSSDPRSAKFLMNWKDGKDPAVELVRQFGTDIADAINDPDRQEEIADANKEFVERVAKEKELDGIYLKNLEESLKVISDYQQKNGLSDEQVDGAMEFLIGITRDAVMGKFTAETIGMAMKALNYDTAVEEANHEGEVRGKNTKIEEKLRKRQKGDGIPNLNSGKGGGATTQRSNRGIFGLAEEAK